jgi:predicted nucleic acid-binding protein
VDSSVLLDVISNDPVHCQSSLASLDAARSHGRLIVCPVVWAEIRAFFKEERLMREALSEAGISFDPFDQESAALGGEHWREYRLRGGKRSRLIADFLVAAHAQVRAGRLLTRDRGFFRRYFEKLQVIEPNA